MTSPQPVGCLTRTRKFTLRGLLAATLALFALAPPGNAATLIFTVSDLADSAPGQDLWEYSYLLGDVSLTANQGFTVIFDRALFTQLQIPPVLISGDWDLLTVQPDAGLNSNGFFDALALRNSPSLADPFKVRFVWLATGTPGPQPFTIYASDFSTISRSQTVPEPSTLALLLAAQGVVIFNRRPRRWSESNPIFPQSLR